MAQRSDYAGRVTGGLNYVVNARTYAIKQMPPLLLLYPRVFWSPDGTSLVWMGTNGDEAAYSIQLHQADVASGRVTDFSSDLSLDSSEFLFVNNALWLPRP